MSFEDDMFEYGFTDGNDYMDYLMDEADQIYDRQQRQELEDKAYEQWVEGLSSEDFEDMESRNKRMQEESEKLRLADRKEKIEKELILKLWANENPEKARIWFNFYSRWPNMEKHEFEEFFNKLGTTPVESSYELTWTGYDEWKQWLEEYECYEEFKTKAHKEWEQWKESVYEGYYKKIVDYLFDDYYKNRSVELNKYFIKWQKTNKVLWTKIKSQYTSSKSNNDLILQLWTETVNWTDKFAVWKFLNHEEWLEQKEIWNKEKPIYLWIKEHKSIWEEWLKEHSELWNEYYKSHYDLLWYIYTENSYCDRDLFEDYMGIITIDPRNRFSNKNMSEEELHLILITEYKQKIEEDKDKSSYIKKNCSDRGLNNFFFEFNDYECDTEEKPENYANRKLMELWIKEHRNQWNQWNQWKFHEFWNNKYNKENSANYVSYCINDYFKVWKVLYPQKWEKWKSGNFKQLKKISLNIDIWHKWILDNNIFTFAQWAEKNINKWRKELYCTMEWDLKFAFHNLFNTYIDFNEWRSQNKRAWKHWKDKIEEQLLKDCWQKDNYLEFYRQEYLLQIKMDEKRYLHQIRGDVFHEHLAIIEERGSYGFCNDKGELVIPIMFDDARNFQDGMAAVNIGAEEYYENYDIDGDTYSDEYMVGGLWGLINTEGQYIVEPSYDFISRFINGYAIYSKGGELFPKLEEDAYNSLYSERVRIINSKYGIMDMNGKEAVPPMYNSIKFLRNGLFAARLGNSVDEKWIIISPLGEIVIPDGFTEVYTTDSEYMLVIVGGVKSSRYKYSQGKWGIIDKSGKYLKDLQHIDPNMSFEWYAKIELSLI